MTKPKAPKKPPAEPANSRASRIRPWMWEPGRSGNPAGRPKDVAAFRAKLRERSDEVLTHLWAVAMDKGHPDQVKVLLALLAHGFGMPEGANRATEDVIEREVERRLNVILAEAERRLAATRPADERAVQYLPPERKDDDGPASK